MKILFLTEGNAETRDSWSGISKSVVEHLRRAGHDIQTGDVDLYGADRWLTAWHSFSPRLERWRVRYRLGRAGFEARSQRAACYVTPARASTDIILQTGATFEPRGRHGAPYVLYCDSNIWMAEYGAQSGYTPATHLTESELGEVRSREAAVYRRASAILTISKLLGESFIQDFGISPRRVHVVHAGPNLDSVAIPNGAIVEREAGPPTVLFVGRQFERKGGDLLLEAFRTVRAQIPDARLVIVGPRRPAREAQQDAGVRWLGFLSGDDPVQKEALTRAYQSAHVFCMPTRFEPFGIVFLEAMHWGLPCVGTATGAVPEMILDGETGFTAPVNDAAALSDRLCRLLCDRQLAHRMGEAGRARALALFTWEAVVRRISDVLEAVIHGEVAHT